MTEKHNSGKTRLKTAFCMLHNKTDPLQDTVIMPIDGSTYGRGVKSHAYKFNNCKSKTKAKEKISKQTLHIHDVPFALHFRRGGSSSHRDPLSKPRANPADDSVTHTHGVSLGSLLAAAGSRIPRPFVLAQSPSVSRRSCRVSEQIQAKNSCQIFLMSINTVILGWVAASCLLGSHFSSLGIRNLTQFA